MAGARAASLNNLEELLRACVSFHERNKDEMASARVRERRSQLAGFARPFHGECGTLTSSVQEKLENLEDGNCIVLMTAHQPNFFAYSGVLRKATLNYVLARKLESVLGIPVVSFFGIADQDFTDDRWVRSCELPAVQRTGGLFSLEVKLPEKLMLYKVPRPRLELLAEWKSAFEGWLNEAIRSVESLCKKLGLQKACIGDGSSMLHENFASFWKVAEDCWRRSKTYSDFNGFLMSKIVNDAWGYDTVFARFSECQQAFAPEFCFLLSRFKDYSRLLKETKEMFDSGGVDGGVSDQEPYLAPFWYHCSCGSKAKLFMEQKDGFLSGIGDCVCCQRHYELDFGKEDDPDLLKIASQISARAVPMGLVFFKGLQPSCYVGGVGGATYLMEAEHVATGLGYRFPVTVVWRPQDRYSGVGQIEALLEIRRLCRGQGVRDVSVARNLLEARVSEIQSQLQELEMLKSEVVEKLKKYPDDVELKTRMREVSIRRTDIVKSSSLSVFHHELKVLDNASKVLSLTPSVIDYAVNVGLKETGVQWERYLNGNGDFHSDVKLESVLDLACNESFK
jgi:hypothetical protein